MRRLAVVLLSALLALAACTTASPAATQVATPPVATPQPRATPTATATATTVRLPTTTAISTPGTPLMLSADGCPAPASTYRNEVMGIAIPVPDGLRVQEPQYLFSDYGVALAGPGESVPFQAIWLYQQTPEQLEALVAEQLAQLADLPTKRAPVVVAGIEGIMLSPVPGVVAHTAVYLPVDGQLFLLLYANDTLDDAGRCLLAGLSFFPPTRTLAELHLPTDSGIPTAPSPTNTEAAPPATPMTLSADSCPTPVETYRNDVLGVALAHSAEQQVIEPQYLGDDDYSVSLARPDKSLLFQVTWLYEETPERLAGVMDELWAGLEGWPVQRVPVTVGGVTGEMLWPVPGEVANTAIYLPVHGRLYRLLYAAEALDDTGRCLLAGLSFFPPAMTLEDLGLPAAATPAPNATLNLTPVSACPPQETYRGEAMGLALAVPSGYRVFKPAAPGDEYTLDLVNVAQRSAVFQVTWFHQATPEQLEAIMAEETQRWRDAPVQPIPITVGGVEGVMLSRSPGTVANAPIFLVVEDRVYRLRYTVPAPALDERLYRLLYAAPAPDNLGRCLLAGVSFFTPTLTLEEQFLTQEAAAQATIRAAATPTPEIHSGWAVYHNDAYGFSFSYPIDRWTIIERAATPHVIALAYHELGIALRIGVARVGEDADLQLYGGAAGEFVPLGETLFLGAAVGRSALVYEDVTRAVHYNETSPIARGDLLFSIALVSNRGYEQGAVVPEEVQAEVERILETFRLAEDHS